MKSMIYFLVPWFLIVLAAAFWLKPVMAGDVAEETTSRRFNVLPDGLLVIDANLGGIDVEPGSDEEVVVEVHRRVELRGGKSAAAVLRSISIDFQQNGNTITVNANAPRMMRVDVGFRVRIPRSFNLNLKTSGGSIRVKGANGEIRCRTSGGGLEFENIRGSVTAAHRKRRGFYGFAPMQYRPIANHIVGVFLYFSVLSFTLKTSLSNALLRVSKSRNRWLSEYLQLLRQSRFVLPA